jgi:hypothetical protein
MCRYRYHYYAACRHHELVLFDFCGKAQSPTATTPTQQVRCDGAAVAAATTGLRGGASTSIAMDDSPSIFSTPSTPKSHSRYSSVEQGLVSITAEPDEDCASLSPLHLSHSSPATSRPFEDMAGLLPFGHTFRSWMGGPTVTAPKQTNVDTQGHVLMGSKRSIEAVCAFPSHSLSIRLTFLSLAARHWIRLSLAPLHSSPAWHQRTNR